MVGVHKSTKGGMWTVVDNYLQDKEFIKKYNIKYIPTAVSGNVIKRLIYSIYGIIKIFVYTLFHNYDILHVHMSERMGVFRKGIIIKISKIRKSKVIIHMHGAEFEQWYKKLSEDKQKIVRDILNSANKVIILGEYWRSFVSSLIEEKSKVEVIYNSVKCLPKNLYNLETNKLLFLGAVSKRKGIYDLLETMKILKNRNIVTKLLIYGPDTTEEIEELIKKNDLSEYVEYKGWLNNKDKERIFTSEIALSILPSYNEGLPMTILETMSYGIPNISTTVAAIPEVLNKENGYINKPGDFKLMAENVIEFLKDNKLREKLSKNSYETISFKFSIKKHIEKISNIYDEVYL